MLRIKVICLFFVLFACFGCAHAPLHEKDYQRWWCHRHNGTLEYRLPDGTRVDCLTKEYAVEVEFAQKWAESIGQALYYAQQTDRTPGIVLIMRTAHDEQYAKRLRTVAKQQGIKVWTVRPRDLDE